MDTLELDTTNAQEPETVDEATLAAIDKALESFEAGIGMTIGAARELNRKRYHAWKNQSHDLTT